MGLDTFREHLELQDVKNMVNHDCIAGLTEWFNKNIEGLPEKEKMCIEMVYKDSEQEGINSELIEYTAKAFLHYKDFNMAVLKAAEELSKELP